MSQLIPEANDAAGADGLQTHTERMGGVRTKLMSNKAALKAYREDLQRRIDQARVLDVDSLRQIGVVFPECMDDSLLLRMDA